jgi:hypothetical protein
MYFQFNCRGPPFFFQGLVWLAIKSQRFNHQQHGDFIMSITIATMLIFQAASIKRIALAMAALLISAQASHAQQKTIPKLGSIATGAMGIIVETVNGGIDRAQERAAAYSRFQRGEISAAEYQQELVAIDRRFALGTAGALGGGFAGGYAGGALGTYAAGPAGGYAGATLGVGLGSIGGRWLGRSAADLLSKKSPR